MNMIKEFLQPNSESEFVVEDKEKVSMKLPVWVVMDQPELSLGPSISAFAETANSSLSDPDANLCRKRKHAWDESIGTQTSIELQLNDPLPMDCEQCLDLQSGRMYYLNRKTLKKSWVRPKEQKIDLELNISTLPSFGGMADAVNSTITTTASHEQYPMKYAHSGGSMIAVACLNCHLLVMLSKSSPSCPNCRYVHSLLPLQPRRVEPVKSLETLSLLR